MCLVKQGFTQDVAAADDWGAGVEEHATARVQPAHPVFCPRQGHPLPSAAASGLIGLTPVGDEGGIGDDDVRSLRHRLQTRTLDAFTDDIVG